MKERGTYKIALTVFGTRSKRLARLARILAGTFEEYGHPVESSKLIDENAASIVASHYRLNVNILRGVAQPGAQDDAALNLFGGVTRRPKNAAENYWRVEIKMTPVDYAQDDRDISEMLLAVMLYRLTSICDAQTVEWLSPETSMTADQFLEAFHTISPAEEEQEKTEKVRRNSRFATVEETVQEISERTPATANTRPSTPWITRDPEMEAEEFSPPVVDISDDELPNDVQRLTVWAMTGLVVFLSAPVAASMAMVNLLRGEDFRFSTHVLALTAFIVVAQSSGALDKAVSQLPL